MAPASEARELVAETLADHHADLVSFVRSRVAPQEVDDILQLAALRAIERADTIDDPERVIAWLYRIHRNLIIDAYRKRSSERKYVDDGEPLPEQPMALADDPCACSVVQARRLPTGYASILSLVDTAGLSIRDAAERLEITANNATVRLHRARKALRQAMLEHCGVTDPAACASCRCVDDVCCAA
jgi:RNA polymerase sigma-70 factor (ECF subfamily)